MQYINELEELSRLLLDEQFLRQASENADYDFSILRSYISTSIEEAKHTLGVIQDEKLEGKRALEFGSGLGIASIVLYKNGFDIVSYEPGGLGFEKNAILNQFIKEHLDLQFTLINSIDELKNESFDFIFSNNVLEHISNIEETFVILNSILKDGGRMIHNIPNYIFPYEPHFGILFFPIYPKRMSFILPKKITGTDLWKSINFVNYYDIKRYARNNNADLMFHKALLYRALVRLNDDEEFGSRHQSIRFVVKILHASGLLSLLKFIPPFLSTPMVFEWAKRD